MKKLIVAVAAGAALIASGLSVANETNAYQSNVVSAQTQNVAQKHHKCKKNKSKKGSKHHRSSKSKNRQ